MTMVITVAFLELEGQSSSSIEDDGRGHGHLDASPLRKGGRWPWSSFSHFLGVGRADLLEKICHDNLSQLAIEEGRKMAMVILLSCFGLEGQTCSSLETMP